VQVEACPLFIAEESPLVFAYSIRFRLLDEERQRQLWWAPPGSACHAAPALRSMS
jgi:hypothetical protein